MHPIHNIVVSVISVNYCLMACQVGYNRDQAEAGDSLGGLSCLLSIRYTGARHDVVPWSTFQR